MATPLRTKQISLRFPLPLLSQVKSQADAKQQAIADWILAAISRELKLKDEPADLEEAHKSQSQPQSELVSYIDEYVQSYVQTYLKKCLEPIYLQVSEINELRLQLGEFKA
jgi:hypothetical protein